MIARGSIIVKGAFCAVQPLICWPAGWLPLLPGGGGTLAGLWQNFISNCAGSGDILSPKG